MRSGEKPCDSGDFTLFLKTVKFFTASSSALFVLARQQEVRQRVKVAPAM